MASIKNTTLFDIVCQGKNSIKVKLNVARLYQDWIFKIDP